MRRAQPVLRRQGDLYGRAGPEVLVRRTALARAAVNDLTAKEPKSRGLSEPRLRFLRLRVGAWGPLVKALLYEWDSIQDEEMIVEWAEVTKQRYQSRYLLKSRTPESQIYPALDGHDPARRDCPCEH